MLPTDPVQAESALRDALGRIEGKPVHALVDAMLDFYETTRFDIGPMNDDNDGLLYQWGTFDWGKGRHFELGLTRQLAVAHNDERILLQLRLTLHYAPTDELSELGEGDLWCFDLEDLDDFDVYISTSPPYLALAKTVPAEVVIEFGTV